jgi:DNA repair exonuclease SbcCD ATPase subunit
MRATLKQITLEDFGPIAGKHTLTFEGPGAYALLAPNGAGKSHVVAGVKLATSPGTELGRPLSAFIHGYGMLEQRSAYVQVVYDVDGEDLVVNRTFSIAEKDPEVIKEGLKRGDMPKGKGKWSVKYRGGNPKAEADVVELLRSLFGIDNRIQEDAVFVMQNRAGEALLAPPSARAKIFQFLCGAEVCQKAAELATQRLNLLQVTDLTDDIATMKGKVSNLQAQIKVTTDCLEACRANVLPDERVKELNRTIELGMQQANLRPVIATEQAAIVKAQQDLAESQRILNAAEMDLQVATTAMTPQYMAEVEKAKATVSAASSLATLITQKQLAIGDRDALQKEGANAKVPVVPTVTAEALAEVEKNLQVLNSTYTASKEFLDVFGKTGACPTCGSKPDGADQLIARHKATVDMLHAQINETSAWINSTRGQLNIYATSVASYNAWLQGWQGRMAAVEKRLESFLTVPDEQNIDASGAAAIVRQYEGLVAQQTLHKQTIATQGKQVESLQTAVANRQEVLRRYEQNMIPLVLEVDIEKARKELATSQSTKEEVAKHAGTLASLNNQLVLDQKDLDRKVGEQERNSVKIKQRRFLDGVKTVLHHSAIPHDRSVAYLRNMNELLAHYCSVVHTPFRLGIDMESFSFMTYSDKTFPQPVSQLSGGQFTLACWAWHLSLYHKHGGQVGFMMLDEPTYGLDARNLENVADGVRYLTKYCHGAGLQMVLVTHESNLASVFDRCLRF